VLVFLAGWIGGAYLQSQEVCVKGRYIGKSGVNGGRLYGLPANLTIEFAVPWTYSSIRSYTNTNKRYVNKRICGMFPHGTATTFERSFGFRTIAKKLEHAQTIGDWHKKARSQAMHFGALNPWGNNHIASTICVNGCDKTGAFWADGCVDGTNCMNAVQYGRDMGTVADMRANNFHMTATNHDCGSCRCGWTTTAAHSACHYLKEFTLYGGTDQGPVGSPNVSSGFVSSSGDGPIGTSTGDNSGSMGFVSSAGDGPDTTSDGPIAPDIFEFTQMDVRGGRERMADAFERTIERELKGGKYDEVMEKQAQMEKAEKAEQYHKEKRYK
jgi:hypothetical protein